MTHLVIGYMTVPSMDVAKDLATVLIDERLAACISIVPSIRSIYRWQEKSCDEQEILLIIKTTSSMIDLLINRATAMHPYDVPEIIFTPVVAGNEPYLQWVKDETMF